ncbi:MAG: precorrin-4 C(11)-methyltransferase [Parabacteroides sp.]|nr:precorrin-4 C(11)-methyltransferase [bacterium]MDY4102094.1 precorrin-4 C(11)-methyltransferase [Parabacteroides sp.]
MKVIILLNETALPLAHQIQQVWTDAILVCKKRVSGCQTISSYADFLTAALPTLEGVVFIGAMGICVRSIVPLMQDKHQDPPVVCIDSTGRYVIPVLSGHVGGANELSRRLATALGGEAIITTQSDNCGLWSLDLLGKRWGWQTDATPDQLNQAIFRFVEQRPTALLMEVRDAGTDWLERHLPAHVRCFYQWDTIPWEEFELLIAVTYRELPAIESLPILAFHPACLHVGVGCRKQCDPTGIAAYMDQQLRKAGVSPLSLASVGTITLKADEPLLDSLRQQWPFVQTHIYTVEELQEIQVPHPSQKAFEVTGLYGVSEAAALKSAQEGPLLIEKQKGCLSEGNHFTYAVALDATYGRWGHIEIVGAGPGDPELVSVRGKRFLETADLILYAGSLVPIELTHYAKPGAVVRSSASMTLEEQFDLMKAFYDQGRLVVRLHTGDPCIYGAIQEQMAFFDRYQMSYHITPGISSFQAAAAALRSQFTIPERVQTIILTRGEGRTPMPEKEQLHKLAQSQSTMCIYLSAGIVEQVQAELLQAYPPETPVAACYKLTWKEERIYRGVLKDLARIVRENGLTLTTLLVVGEAIDNRQGVSRLYSHQFKHLFRP